MLGLFGKDDRYPTPDSVATLDAELDRLGKDHTFFSYDARATLSSRWIGRRIGSTPRSTAGDASQSSSTPT
jgi:hypothetical protein